MCALAPEYSRPHTYTQEREICLNKKEWAWQRIEIKEAENEGKNKMGKACLSACVKPSQFHTTEFYYAKKMCFCFVFYSQPTITRLFSACALSPRFNEIQINLSEAEELNMEWKVKTRCFKMHDLHWSSKANVLNTTRSSKKCGVKKTKRFNLLCLPN